MEFFFFLGWLLTVLEVTGKIIYMVLIYIYILMIESTVTQLYLLCYPDRHDFGEVVFE